MLLLLFSLILLFSVTGCGSNGEKQNNNGQQEQKYEEKENNNQQNNSNNNYVDDDEIIEFDNDDREWFINSYDEVCKLSAPKKKMYLLQCRYANGNHFEEDIYNRLFESQEIAKEELCKEVKNVEEEFNRLFGNEWQFEWSKNGLCCCIDFNCYEDYWEGYVEELKVN